MFYSLSRHGLPGVRSFSKRSPARKVTLPFSVDSKLATGRLSSPTAGECTSVTRNSAPESLCTNVLPFKFVSDNSSRGATLPSLVRSRGVASFGLFNLSKPVPLRRLGSLSFMPIAGILPREVGERLVGQRFSGVRPVCLAMRASIRGPISSLS